MGAGIYDDHSSFLQDPDRFNQCLRDNRVTWVRIRSVLKMMDYLGTEERNIKRHALSMLQIHPENRNIAMIEHRTNQSIANELGVTSGTLLNFTKKQKVTLQTTAAYMVVCM